MDMPNLSRVVSAGARSALLAIVIGAPALAGQAAPGDSLVRPLGLSLSYTGDLMGNVAGGRHRGATFSGAAGAEVTVRLGRLVSWHGARVFASVLGTHGGAPSAFVGDVQGVSSLQAPAAVRLEEVWLQQNLLADRLSLLAGRYDLNTEFSRLQSAALFLNSSFGIGPELGRRPRGVRCARPSPAA